MSDTPDGSHGDTRPVPDPTALTTEASARLEKMLREQILSEIAHQNTLFDEKLSGVFRQITTQLTMLDARTAEQKKDTKDALDAALAAAKEAVANQSTSSEKSITKSETATIERIKAVETLLTASTTAMDDKIGDLKDRVVAIESVKLGTVEGAATVRQSGADSRAILTSIIGVILALIAIAGFVVAALKP